MAKLLIIVPTMIDAPTIEQLKYRVVNKKSPALLEKLKKNHCLQNEQAISTIKLNLLLKW